MRRQLSETSASRWCVWHETALLGMDDPRRQCARSATARTDTSELARFNVGLEKKEISMGG